MSPMSHERPRMPRMADVAARAGVSHQTVSRVLNGMPGVRPETHDRVVAAGDLSETPRTAGVDTAQGARLATSHLLSLGHETVVHLSGPMGWAESHARRDGWRAELESQGRRVPPLRWGGDWSSRSGYL